MGFDEVFEEFFDDSAEVVFFLVGESYSLEGGASGFEGGEFGGVDAGSFVDGGHEIDAVPWFGEVDTVIAGGSVNFVADMAEEVFDTGHHVFEVGVGFVPFEESEFGVVAVGDALVAEDAADFVDFGDVTANDAFEIEF